MAASNDNIHSFLQFMRKLEHSDSSEDDQLEQLTYLRAMMETLNSFQEREVKYIANSLGITGIEEKPLESVVSLLKSEIKNNYEIFLMVLTVKKLKQILTENGLKSSAKNKDELVNRILEAAGFSPSPSLIDFSANDNGEFNKFDGSKSSGTDSHEDDLPDPKRPKLSSSTLSLEPFSFSGLEYVNVTAPAITPLVDLEDEELDIGNDDIEAILSSTFENNPLLLRSDSETSLSTLATNNNNNFFDEEKRDQDLLEIFSKVEQEIESIFNSEMQTVEKRLQELRDRAEQQYASGTSNSENPIDFVDVDPSKKYEQSLLRIKMEHTRHQQLLTQDKQHAMNFLQQLRHSWKATESLNAQKLISRITNERNILHTRQKQIDADLAKLNSEKAMLEKRFRILQSLERKVTEQLS